MKRFLIPLMALLVAASVHAGLTGRLFLTPQQRAVLERLRQHHATATAGRPRIADVTLNGIVERSDGHDTLWLNDRALSSEQAALRGAGTMKKDGPDYALKIQDSPRIVRLKVGQRYNPASGEVEEASVRRHGADTNGGAPFAAGRTKAEPHPAASRP